MIDYVKGIRPSPGGMEWIDAKKDFDSHEHDGYPFCDSRDSLARRSHECL